MSCPYYCWNNHYACQKSGTKKDVSEDVYSRYCAGYDYSDCPIYKGGSEYEGSCFLTSACVEANGLADDCQELTVLRAFRDGYLQAQDHGDEEIAEYYRIAPAIVERVRTRSDAMSIFDAIYKELVLPCVELIDSGKNAEAHRLYRDYTLKLKAAYLG